MFLSYMNMFVGEMLATPMISKDGEKEGKKPRFLKASKQKEDMILNHEICEPGGFESEGKTG